jgi:hypothetical protein
MPVLHRTNAFIGPPYPSPRLIPNYRHINKILRFQPDNAAPYRTPGGFFVAAKHEIPLQERAGRVAH